MHTITASTIALILASGLAGAQTPVADESPASDTTRVPGVDRALGEDTVIRTFVLEHADPKEVDRLLRSLLGVRNVAVQERLNAVVIRDTGGIMPAIERLIEIVDQPRGEVDVEVELLRLRTNSDITAADLRMSASEFLALGNSEGAKSIARSTLSLMEAGNGRLHLESGKPRSPSTQFDLTLRARQHPATEEITLEVTAELDPSVGEANLDTEAIHASLSNLVSNAIDACLVSDHKGGHVTVRTRERDGCLELEVEDDGCGMDYEVKRKVFTTFFTTKGTEGTGLGLLVTKKAVQEHGGSIDINSTPGAGSVFRIVLPRDRLPRPTPEDDKQQEGGAAV